MTRQLSGACVLWQGSLTPDGYGRFSNRLAHVSAFVAKFGAIPDGTELDHLCHTLDPTCKAGGACPHRRCVNPDHLEPVSHRENSLRGRSFAAANASKTHCPEGHPYDEVNTYYLVRRSHTSRGCRACNSAAARRYRNRQAS